MVRAVLIAMLAGSSALLGCAEDKLVPRTQLMLVADTDLQTLDRIDFEVSGEGNRRQSESAAVAGSAAPFTMAVVRESGPLGPVTVSARAYRGSTLLVERSALVSFVPNKTLVVALHLLQSCVLTRCDDDEACTERGCEPLELVANELPTWNGTPPRLGDADEAGTVDPDAGEPTGGDAGQGPDAANWAECSGQTVDLSADLDNCGRCNRPCRSSQGENTQPACIDGACASACRALWGDCDEQPNNGCEAFLGSDDLNCGACALRCAPSESCSLLGSCRSSSSGQN